MVKRYENYGDPRLPTGLYVHESDYDALLADFLALKEHCAALESREVCAVAHENVETCGYCQRDALQRQNQHLLTVTKQQARRIESMEAGLTPRSDGCPLCGRTDPHSHTAGPMGML